MGKLHSYLSAQVFIENLLLPIAITVLAVTHAAGSKKNYENRNEEREKSSMDLFLHNEKDWLSWEGIV